MMLMGSIISSLEYMYLSLSSSKMHFFLELKWILFKFAIFIRLGEILEKWSDSVCYLSIVIVCVNLKNATPILVPRPKDDVTRPFEISDNH